MSNKLKSFKNLIAMSALSAVASFGNTAKAETNMGEIQDVTQTPNGTLIIKKNADAEIGGVKTPWMFARPDGQSAFANHFTTNATEVVSDGSNVYSHVAGEGKVTHFTLSPDGIPSTNGVEYALINSDKSTNTTAQLLAASKGGVLYTVNFETEPSLAGDRMFKNIKFPIIRSYTNANDTADERFVERYSHDLGKNIELVKNLYFQFLNSEEPSVSDSSLDETSSGTQLSIIDNFGVHFYDYVDRDQNDISQFIFSNKRCTAYTYSGKNVRGLDDGTVENTNTRLGPITSLSTLTNGNVVACSEGHGCVELEPYWGEKVDPPAEPALANAPTNTTFKIIDNRGKKNGALLYVTRKNIGILSR